MKARRPSPHLLLIAAAAPAARRSFDPVEFFPGRTHGEGTLKSHLPVGQDASVVDSVGQSTRRTARCCSTRPSTNRQAAADALLASCAKPVRTASRARSPTPPGPVRVDVSGDARAHPLHAEGPSRLRPVADRRRPDARSHNEMRVARVRHRRRPLDGSHPQAGLTAPRCYPCVEGRRRHGNASQSSSITSPGRWRGWSSPRPPAPRSNGTTSSSSAASRRSSRRCSSPGSTRRRR